MLNGPLEAMKGQVRDGSLWQIDRYDGYELRVKFQFYPKAHKKVL